MIIICIVLINSCEIYGNVFENLCAYFVKELLVRTLGFASVGNAVLMVEYHGACALEENSGFAIL